MYYLIEYTYAYGIIKLYNFQISIHISYLFLLFDSYVFFKKLIFLYSSNLVKIVSFHKRDFH